jgi:alkaline phosphatase
MSYKIRRHVSQALAAALLATVAIQPVAAADTAVKLLERGASQELSVPGGARRISGDITEAYRAAIVDGRPKNVILLIGDGMGDSEITIARNYAVGAGQYFKGIDALPVTGQYTHYSLDKKTGKPTYVTTRPHRAPPGQPA